MKKAVKKYVTRQVKRNVGSYVLIERFENDEDYGKDVLLGQAKFISQKSVIQFDQPKVLYFEKDIQGQVKLDGKLYDALYYYDILINFQTMRDEIIDYEEIEDIDFKGLIQL